MIKNDVLLNEELDPKLMIQKLKKEIQQLREELAMATGEQRTDELTEEDLERLKEFFFIKKIELCKLHNYTFTMEHELLEIRQKLKHR